MNRSNRLRLRRLTDVVEWNLCIGCGACAFYCPTGAVALRDVAWAGCRPKLPDRCRQCTECLSFCPGYSVTAPRESAEAPKGDGLLGGRLGIFEGHSADDEIRCKGSSGGVITALGLYCLEREDMALVLHTGADAVAPWRTGSVTSRSRGELLQNTGSRYAPSSPVAALRIIEESDRTCIFVCKPCDAAAVSVLRRMRPRLNRNLGLVLSIFCAGTPATAGTMDVLHQLNVRPSTATRILYRGEGWPGSFQVTTENGTGEMSYRRAWSILQRHRPLRCHLCPDGFGECSDISCGDAWYRLQEHDDPGESLILGRTQRGMEVIRAAEAAGYLSITASSREAVLASQGLQERRRQLAGRLLAMRLLSIPVPRYRGFSLIRSWLSLGLLQMIKTVLGTVKRCAVRGYWHRNRRLIRFLDSSS